MMLQLNGNVVNVLLMLGNPGNGPPSAHCPAKKADVKGGTYSTYSYSPGIRMIYNQLLLGVIVP